MPRAQPTHPLRQTHPASRIQVASNQSRLEEAPLFRDNCICCRKRGYNTAGQDRHTQILIYRVAHMLFPYVLAATSISFSLCPFPHRITPFPQTIKSAVRWLGVILTGVWKFTTESLQVNLKSFTPLSFPFLPLWRSKNFKSNDFYRYFTISPYESPVSPHLPCVVGFGQWTWLWQQSLSRGLTQLKWKRSQQHERPKSS